LRRVLDAQNFDSQSDNAVNDNVIGMHDKLMRSFRSALAVRLRMLAQTFGLGA